MALFDAVEDEVTFDEKSGIHLFETQQKRDRSVHDYLKKFLPVAIVAALGLGIFGYWALVPGAGDQVRPTNEMWFAVADHMQSKEKRTASEMSFFLCDGFYWVRVVAQPRSYPPSNPYDAVNQYRVTARQQPDGSWQMATLPSPAKEEDVPCRQ